MNRILIVANDFPYPLTHGAAIDMWGHIQTLKKLGYSVDMAVTTRELPADAHIHVMNKEVDQLMIIERQKGWRTAAGVSPFQVLSRAGLTTIPLSKEYLAVVLMAEHVAPILLNPSLRASKRILRLHNDETRFFRELSRSSKNPFRKLFYQLEAGKFSLLSPKLMSNCDALWFISNHEKNQHVKLYPNHLSKSFFVPPLVDVADMRCQALEGQNVLFIGTLALANNARAIEWYITNVHSSLCDIAGYSFVAAGNTRGKPSHALRNFLSASQKITLYEDPDNIQNLYNRAAVFVNPVFRGAGLKLKTIDAIRAGLPVVTTSTGVEGTGLVHNKHLLIADSPESFSKCVRHLLNDKRMAKDLVISAQRFLVREFDQPRIIKNALAKVLEKF